MQPHDDLNTVEKSSKCPLTRKSAEVVTNGCTSSVKGLTSFPCPLFVFPSLIILVLISRVNLNQFALNHATVPTKLLMRCLITLSVQDELWIQDECMLSSSKCFYTDSPNCNCLILILSRIMTQNPIKYPLG